VNLFAINAAAINGSAEQIWNGSGDASITMALSGQAIKAAVGQSSAALSLAATGNAQAAKIGAGAGALALAMGGYATPATAGRADAGISFVSQAFPASGVSTGYGDATILFVGRYGIPAIQRVPWVYKSGPPSRLSQAGQDVRTIEVPADKPLLVRERRSDPIQYEGRQA
jgi:hypothetical protein